MTISSETLIVGGVALAVIYLANQAVNAANAKIDDAKQSIKELADSAKEAWEAAKNGVVAFADATVETVTPAGVSLYDQRATTKRQDYTPGDINNGAVF